MDINAAKHAANTSIIVILIALNSATNNLPIKLLFAVLTAPNMRASNLSLPVLSK